MELAEAFVVMQPPCDQADKAPSTSGRTSGVPIMIPMFCPLILASVLQDSTTRLSATPLVKSSSIRAPMTEYAKAV